MFLAKKLNRGAGTVAPPATTDAQFNYVTMLLHCDGTNGAQNNTFLDSGPNTFSITRGGNTTQGSFSPYGSNWSNNFDGSGDYLQTGNAANLALGTGNFTIECWFNRASGNNNGLFQLSTTVGGFVESDVNNLAIGLSDSTINYYVNNNTYATSTVSIPNGTWKHIALVRNGTTTTLYYNGVSVGSVSDSKDYTATYLVVGGYYSSSYTWNGLISNFRIVKGTAVYTSAFTPPTASLSAITNTQLLTCQANRFIDSSANAYALTVSGNTSVQRFNPFGASTAYSTSVIGGSAYFDGSGDYLSGPTNNSAFQFGTGDFTVEAWVYLTANNDYPSILEIGNHLTTTGILFIYWGSSGGNVAAIYSGGFKGSTPVTMNAWNHIAYVRSSGSLKIYVNGVSPAGVTFTNDLTNSNKVTIGTDQNLTAGYYFTGNISNLRVVKGTAVYTADFTPPTTPLTAISGTSLLMPMTNAAIIDNAMMNNLETVGNAQISTSVKKYGTGSIYFDSSGDALYSKSQSVTFGTGDFTLEFWINFNAVNNSTVKFIYDMRNSGATSASFLAQEAGNTWTYWNGAGTSISSGFTSSTFTDSTWTHVAICRSSGTTRFFAGGTLTNSVADTSNYANSTLTFGARYSISDFLNAWIDDLRITKGYARYTATFTPPTAAFLDIGPN